MSIAETKATIMSPVIHDYDADGLIALAKSHDALLEAGKDFVAATQTEDMDKMGNAYMRTQTAIEGAEK